MHLTRAGISSRTRVHVHQECAAVHGPVLSGLPTSPSIRDHDVHPCVPPVRMPGLLRSSPQPIGRPHTKWYHDGIPWSRPHWQKLDTLWVDKLLKVCIQHHLVVADGLPHSQNTSTVKVKILLSFYLFQYKGFLPVHWARNFRGRWVIAWMHTHKRCSQSELNGGTGWPYQRQEKTHFKNKQELKGWRQ